MGGFGLSGGGAGLRAGMWWRCEEENSVMVVAVGRRIITPFLVFCSSSRRLPLSVSIAHVLFTEGCAE